MNYPSSLRISPIRDLLARIENWEQFEKHAASLGNSEKGKLFEHLVKHFLELDPKFQSKLEKVWLFADVPHDVRQAIGLPPTDQGIDLIAVTRDGEYWAIQAKYRTDTLSALSWPEVATFAGLAFGTCKQISFGLLCTTTERLSRTIPEYPNLGFCTNEVWRHLDEEFFARLRAHVLRDFAPLVPLNPKPHQLEAVEAAKKHYLIEQNALGKLIMACGTGKTLAAFWITQAIEAQSIVVVVPSLALIKQNLSAWLREIVAAEKRVNWLCVCSDDSVADIDEDSLIGFTKDLGIPCSTNAEYIAAWLKAHNGKPLVVFVTYQSGRVFSEAVAKAETTFDFGVFDEAHKTTGNQDKIFAHMLFDANLPIRQRLFMTATERKYIGYSDRVASMEHVSTYGHTFHSLSFKHAIEAQPPLLSDYRVVTVVVHQEEVARLIERNAYLATENAQATAVTARALASVIALRKAVEQFGIKHAISFHSSIKRAKDFAGLCDTVSKSVASGPQLHTYHVSGSMATSQRDRILTEFTLQTPSLVANARCLTEGVDIPAVDAVFFADPKSSTIDVVQACGRAMRLSPGKQLGYIVVPLVVQAGEKVDDIISGQEFESVLAILRSLASNDGRIIEYFRSISSGGTSKYSGLVTVESSEIVPLQVDTESFIKAIELACWERISQLGWRPFEEAREYARSLGLKSQADWNRFVREPDPAKQQLPLDIPRTPNFAYQALGWKGFPDWLGYGMAQNSWWPFERARKFSQSLGISSQTEWRDYCAGRLSDKPPRPFEMPSTPEKIYQGQGWSGYGDWLGTGRIASHKRFTRTFEAAREFARSLKFSSSKEWWKYCRGEIAGLPSFPEDMNVRPDRSYKHRGWAGWEDWLGLGPPVVSDTPSKRRGEYKSFAEAREFVRALGLSGQKDWARYCRGDLPEKGTRPDDIPGKPREMYKNEGWLGFGDWVGTGAQKPSGVWRPFAEAREFARGLGLKDSTEWQQYAAGNRPDLPPRPRDIPSGPHMLRAYKEAGWAGYPDWIGKKTFKNYEEAKSFVHTLGLRTTREWEAFCQGKYPHKGTRPPDIPRSPEAYYRDKGWKDYKDWLGLK
ncbi:MAG: DEAD/DEAH box helicase family protein [Burkholderiales bacterium]|nr:DEAD/DEAH box helicase family protein [Burkholderiales bacterium]